jgi:hypothetical protein
MKCFAHGSGTEAKFASLAASKGWEAHRSGWPDFLIVKDGKPCFVEVKSTDDELRPSQVKMFRALETTGLSVLVWWELYPDRLMPWKRFRKMRREASAVAIASRKLFLEQAASRVRGPGGLTKRGAAAVKAALAARATRR